MTCQYRCERIDDLKAELDLLIQLDAVPTVINVAEWKARGERRLEILDQIKLIWRECQKEQHPTCGKVTCIILPLFGAPACPVSAANLQAQNVSPTFDDGPNALPHFRQRKRSLSSR